MPRLKPSGCRRPPESSPAAPRGRGASLRTCFLRRLPAVFALLLLAALAAPAQAATLVSNIGQSDDNHSPGGTAQDLAQGFTTGSSGATLASIEMRLSGSFANRDHPTVTLHSGTATSAVVATLSAPAGTIGTAAANYTYTAPANTTLAASTTYYVVMVGGSFGLNARETESDNEDSGGQTDWSIADNGKWRTGGSTGDFNDLGNALLIRVNGTATTTTADTTAPAFASAAADGASLVITFDEDLAAAASLANSAFTVKKTASGGSEATVALSITVAPVISGTTVTLTLGTALVSTDGSVKVTYTKPTTGSANKLVDAASNETATFTDQTVTNNTPAVTVTVPGAPTSFAATAGDAAVTLSWAAPASNGGGAITKYRYRYSTGSVVSSSATWTDVADGSDSDTETGNETGVTISSLTNGTEYAFEVLAVNSVGEGAAAGPVTATPAAASCTAPSFGTRRNIWTGTVTVGSTTGVVGFLGATGALDDKTFSIGSSNHEIDALFLDVRSIDNPALFLSLKDTDLTSAEKAALRLHVCNTATVDLSATIVGSTAHNYSALYSGANWTSGSTLAVYLSLPANNAATGAPTISGTVAVGHTLMAAKGTIADVDGVPTTLTYQWLRVDGANETDITGATESSYTVTADDIGKTLKVKLGFTDDLSGVEARSSAATATVAQPPTVSIAAVYPNALIRVANPEFRVTISAAQTSAVTVNLSIDQDASYLSSTTQSIEIQANQTSATKKFSGFYSGTTSGDLTATVAAGTGYVPAAPPANAATVSVLAPGLANVLSYQLAEAAYSVDEGDSLDVVVMLRTAAGVPKPRESMSVSAILTEQLTGEADRAILNVDYTHTSESGGAFAPDEWTADGAVFTATRTHTIPTTEDSVYEGNERFKILLTAASGAIGSKGSPGETIVTIVDDEALKVTGVAVSSTPSGSSTYGAGETISFTATFSAKVTVTGTPQLPFSLGGVTQQAAYASGSDSTALVFSYTVAAGDNDADGVSWSADALSLNGGAIKFMTSIVANQVDAALTHAAKTARSGHKVDTPPVLSTPTVNGTALVLTYNEALDTGSAPASSAFTVKVGGTAVSLATSGAVGGRRQDGDADAGRGGDGGGYGDGELRGADEQPAAGRRRHGCARVHRPGGDQRHGQHRAGVYERHGGAQLHRDGGRCGGGDGGRRGRRGDGDGR